MQLTNDQPSLALEHALEGLQRQRETCVRRLEAALEADSAKVEIDAYLARIDSINTALIRLASTHAAA